MYVRMALRMHQSWHVGQGNKSCYVSACVVPAYEVPRRSRGAAHALGDGVLPHSVHDQGEDAEILVRPVRVQAQEAADGGAQQLGHHVREDLHGQGGQRAARGSGKVLSALQHL